MMTGEGEVFGDCSTEGALSARIEVVRAEVR